MEVWFSHGMANWTRRGWQEFKWCVGAEIGLNIFAHPRSEQGWANPKWQRKPLEPLIPLFKLSPVKGMPEGSMTPEQCRLAAPRLREILGGRKWLKDALLMGHRLADAMEGCAVANEALTLQPSIDRGPL